MKHLRYGTGHQNRHGEQHRAAVPAVLVLCLLPLVALAIGLSSSAIRVSAAGEDGLLFQQATAVSTTGAGKTAPGPVGTASVAPPPKSTGQVPLPPVPQSSQVVPANPGSNVQPGNGGSQAAPPANGQSVTTAPLQVASDGFPWWLLIPLALVALAVGAFALMKGRTAQAAVTTASMLPPSTRSSAVATPATFTTETGGKPGVAPYMGLTEADIAPVVAAGLASVAVPSVSPPGQVECPNCGALNSMDENFCHECGQDLKQARAGMAAGIANDPIDEHTPYLETLGRTDEQLEYVLSRPRVTIGSAPNNDIVIDTTFRGLSTVSPVHAELRRHDDGFTILDRGSNTGTYVNSARITEQPLLDNDQIRVGEVRFVYHAPARS